MTKEDFLRIVETSRHAGRGTSSYYAMGVKILGEQEAQYLLDHPSPTLVQKAVGLAKAVGTFVAAGLPMVSNQEKERRLTICRDCPEFLPNDQVCGKCHCWLSIKSEWATAHCPLGKW